MPRIVANAVNTIARQTIGKDWLLYAALLDHWPEIVGQEYAEVTTPVKITFPHQPNEPRRRGGTVTVRLPKGLAMEFSFKTEHIKQRVNGYFGYDAIVKVLLEPVSSLPTQRKASPPPITAEAQTLAAETVKEMPSGELRDALQSFGQTLLSGEPARKKD